MGIFDGLAGSSLGFVGGFLDRKSNKDLMREQNAFQSQESQKSRDWQSNENQLQRDWERKQWEDTNKYNSLSEVMKRITAAGANPFMLAGDAGSVGTGGFASVPTSGMSGSGAAAQAIAPPYQSTNSSWSNSFSDMASAMESLASAKKTGLDTSLLENSMNDVLRGLKADADGKELQNAYQQILNKYEGQLKDKELKKLDETVNNLVADTSLKNASRSEVSQRINESKARVKDILAHADLTKEQKRQLKHFTDNIMDKYYNSIIKVNASTVKLNNAKATESYASANELNTRSIDNIASSNLKSALTVTENTLRDDRAKQQKAVAIIDDLRAKIKEHTFAKDKELALKQAVEQIEREGIITKQAAAELKRAEAEGDWAQIYYFFRALHEGTRIQTEGLNASANALDAVIPF
ncbi:DNA pilot protein [Dipodfec virus RodF1_12]|uniref:DNA pilot protein n=1 Tax=Dipodfec virus RodF1_12 TaxID=2929289 RepID=A0A976N344_9VIRU|nr:DNA pilot protein [Dipodfec virus RodF1_12]